MKIFEIQTSTLFCLTLLVGFCVTNTACLAQEKAKQGSIELSETAEIVEDNPFDATEDILNDHKFDIVFSQSTRVEDFVAFLREKTDDRVNFIVQRDARNVMVPPLELREVSVYSGLKAMGELTEVYFDEDADLGFMIRNEAVSSLEVFNVSQVLDKTVKGHSSLLSAIEIGLEMNNSSLDNVSLKFHEETKLLFVKAIDTDLDIVIQVLEQLGGRPLNDPKEGGAGKTGGGAF